MRGTGSTTAKSVWASPAAPAAWLSVRHQGKVKEAEGMTVGTCGFVRVGGLGLDTPLAPAQR